MAIDEAKMLEETTAVMTSDEYIEMPIGIAELWLLVQACQLTVTHPTLSATLKQGFEVLGRRLQQKLGANRSEEFREFMEMGWHREHDEKGIG